MTEERALASACGLFCGVCPRFQSTAPSRCPGCHLGEVHSYCGVFRCCVTKRGHHSCAECPECPCSRLLRSLKVEEELDGFMPHRPALENLERIREGGLDAHLARQSARLALVRELLAGWNDGRSTTLYCTACALLPPDRVRSILDQHREASRGDEDPRKRIRAMKEALHAVAAEEGVSLALRRRR